LDKNRELEGRRRKIRGDEFALSCVSLVERAREFLEVDCAPRVLFSPYSTDITFPNGIDNALGNANAAKREGVERESAVQFRFVVMVAVVVVFFLFPPKMQKK
jgi:hypothetical protein